jgi:hypothetical protein
MSHEALEKKKLCEYEQTKKLCEYEQTKKLCEYEQTKVQNAWCFSRNQFTHQMFHYGSIRCNFLLQHAPLLQNCMLPLFVPFATSELLNLETHVAGHSLC